MISYSWNQNGDYGMNDEVCNIFNKFDKNGDGKISLLDPKEMLSMLGSKTTSDEVKRMKERIDQNGNGYIDLKEFADFHCTHIGDAARKDDELHDAIDLYDLDKDGLISPKELHIVLNKLGEKYSLGDYLRMISNVDVDDDGNINFEEFKKMMAR